MDQETQLIDRKPHIFNARWLINFIFNNKLVAMGYYSGQTEYGASQEYSMQKKYPYTWKRGDNFRMWNSQGKCLISMEASGER